MESVRDLPTLRVYALLLVLRYLAKWEKNVRQFNAKAHWLGSVNPGWIYPEKRRYIIQFLSYKIYVSLSLAKLNK